ncbi:hypothetical protein ACQQ5V_02930 [Synechocystis sp. PCC 6803]|uniref:hypothetical protein n=1 Tax=unclassified Synechocystis TaxID=2640012 RepID=UPI00030AA63A|nr:MULTISPECIES: hypothetical protein [unclassified Synechocystis]MBD2617220.1 hypothetical protein [Synechocystis sp. FACHB-898]MBD2639652.1 hypothetical protein [Synechocystis sp. FACHB-908]MBD2660056.1 hypothetical protein [Synechocystis sp. FACHB-929]NHL97728.1 hypothetical protein [Synechocystis sp. PCC 6803]
MAIACWWDEKLHIRQNYLDGTVRRLGLFRDDGSRKNSQINLSFTPDRQGQPG